MTTLDKNKSFFVERLLLWHQQNPRPMPWKETQNAYYIWLSEIILQQTRVQQGLPYYKAFVKRFPKVEDLAAAPEEEVLKLWEGLGYYSRARNLHYTAKHITTELNGIFPNTFETIKKLKGVGEYTAAAIASFAYDLPHAVVDGNVYRVLSRFFGISTPIDTTEGKKIFKKLADQLLEKKDPATYNQAIMNFGALHCLPKKAKCTNCLLASACKAQKDQKVGEYPVKSKKLKKKDRFFYYIIAEDNGQFAIQKREEKDIWQGLYEFPLIELEKLVGGQDFFKTEKWKAWIGDSTYHIQQISSTFRQVLSHQKINAIFIKISLPHIFFREKRQFLLIDQKNLQNFALPKIINQYIENKNPSLGL